MKYSYACPTVRGFNLGTSEFEALADGDCEQWDLCIELPSNKRGIVQTEAPMDADSTIPSRLPTMEEEAGVQGDEIPEEKIQQAQAKCGSPMRYVSVPVHCLKRILDDLATFLR